MFITRFFSLLFVISALLLTAAGCTQPDESGESLEEVIRHNIVGTAYLGQQKWTDAKEAFDKALALRSDDPLLLTNKAVAEFQQGEVDAAVELLNQALAADPDHLQAHYNLGLIDSRNGDFESAVTHFESVAKTDPQDLFTQYYLGTSLSRVERDDEAIVALRNALERDPNHVSSLYGLGRLLIQKGDQEEGTRMITLSQQIRARSGLDEAVGGQYGEQGPYALGIDYPGDALEAPAPLEVKFAAGPRARLEPGAAGSIAWTLAPMGADASPTMLVAQRGSVLQLFPAGRSQPIAPVSPGQRPIVSLAAGDMDNDGRVDLASLLHDDAGGRLIPALLLQQEDGSFAWKDDAFAGQATNAAAAAAIAVVDRDHDGDLDLFWCWNGGDGGCMISTNDGSARFESKDSIEHGFSVKLSGSGVPIVMFSDLDNDRDVDLLVGDAGGVRMFSNQRDDTYKDVSERIKLGSAVGDAGSLVLADLNKDGWMDLLLGGENARLCLNRRGTFDAPVPLDKEHSASTAGVIAFDFDNDGFLDLLRGGETTPRVLRNQGQGRWSPVADAADAQDGSVTPLAALDADRDGDLDLVTVADGVVGLYVNQGGNANHWIDLAPGGVGDNKFGIGAKVEVLAGALRQKFEVTGPLPIHAGLGNRSSVQSARFVWPSGVLQDEIELDAGATARIAQLDRKGTSCPLLYAWRDGGWQFVTDFLGGCAIGYQHRPGVFSVPDTDEYVLVEGGLTEHRDGRVGLRLNNQLEEVIWFDQVELIAVDHPAGTSVFPNERLMPGPPFPEFELFASNVVRPIAGARDPKTGHDLTKILADRDRRYVANFRLERPKGYAEDHSVELDLGPFDRGERVVLLLDGWIDYADSSANVAAYQAGLSLVPPRLFVADGSGGWRLTEGLMGFPAGLPKTMAVEVSGLFPSGDHRVRIDTNMRIYWDRARVLIGGEETPLKLTRLKPRIAELSFGGYPRETSPDGLKPLDYDPNDVAMTSMWRTHVGSYTAFGDVRDLLQTIDDRFVTTRHGDELELWFDAPRRSGDWSRTYLLFADGFGKDMDPNSAANGEVGPIPFHEMPRYPYDADVAPPVEPPTDGRYRHVHR